MIHFTIDLSESRSHLLKVTMEFESKKGEEKIVMPVWAPGSYMVRDFSRHISWINAEQGTIKQIDKTSYLLQGNKIKLNYGVYAEELSVQTSYADSDFVLINGSSLFFYVDGRKEEEYRIKIIHNQHNFISTSMVKEDNELLMNNYDDFVDSPILIHDGLVNFFKVDNKEHEVATVGNFKRDFSGFTENVKKIVESAKDIFKELPYEKKYTFLFILAPEDIGGGLEHKGSTVIMGNENKILNDFDYLIFQSVISHEFFHTWNVKRIRPVELGPFDYTKENYTKLLWLSEGFTSYYEWIILLKAGIAKIEDYANHLSDALNYYFIQPGYAYRDANSSSFNAWIKLYKPDGDLINNYISYYLKGELMALALNHFIYKNTGGTKNIDDFMRSLWARYKETGKGITYEELIELVSGLVGKDSRKMFENLAELPGDMGIAEKISELGFQVEKEEKEQGFLGIVFQSNNGKITVRYSLKGYPAYDAGIVPGDEIIAVNDERMNESYIEEYVKEWKGMKVDNIKWLKSGQPTKITFFRRNVLKNVNFITAKYPLKYTVKQKDADIIRKILFP